jgi:hypothetical protein
VRVLCCVVCTTCVALIDAGCGLSTVHRRYGSPRVTRISLQPSNTAMDCTAAGPDGLPITGAGATSTAVVVSGTLWRLARAHTLAHSLVFYSRPRHLSRGVAAHALTYAAVQLLDGANFGLGQGVGVAVRIRGVECTLLPSQCRYSHLECITTVCSGTCTATLMAAHSPPTPYPPSTSAPPPTHTRL